MHFSTFENSESTFLATKQAIISRVPFGRASKRTLESAKTTKYTPGPGTYSTSYAGFDRVKEASQQIKQQKEFGVDQLTMQNVKPSSNFASRVPRFNQKKKGVNPNLGPDRYVPQDEWVKPGKAPPKPEFQQVQWQRAPNPPSIPSHDNVFGYEETKAGDLKKQKNPEKVTTGVKSDIVGPGHYSIPDSFKQKKGVVKWRKQNKKKKQADNLGPGHYEVDKVQIVPGYKMTKSAVFKSRVERATSVQVKKRQKNRIPVGNSRPITAYHNVIKQKVGFLETENDDESDEDIPGPGYYVSNENITAFNPQNVPQRQQFFGSTVARFEDKRTKNKVGPGSYSYEMSSTSAGTRASSHYQQHKPPFSSSGARFEPKKAEEEPGPGQYTQEGAAAARRPASYTNNKRAFGTTERRFVGKRNTTTPGPGQYKPENNIHQLDHKKTGINSYSTSAMFKSKVPRNPYNQGKKKSKEPDVGSYEVKQYTIEEQIKKKGGVGFENPLLANLKTKTKDKVPFSSKVDRFKDKVGMLYFILKIANFCLI